MRVGVRLGSRLAAACCALLAVAVTPNTTLAAGPVVRLVCNNTTFKCPALPAGWNYYPTIQQAVDAAQANDWILVWPGDYRENGNTDPEQSAGLWIGVDSAGHHHGAAGIFIRGMDRNLVMVDGTKSGPECSSNAGDQNPGPPDPTNGNQPAGRDGVVVWQTEQTWLENFSACNFLTSSSGKHGNQIWWNGGDGSGSIGLHSYWGDYLTATSTYSNGNDNPRGEYGIFSSNTGNGVCFAGGKQLDGTEVGPGGNCYTGFMNHSYANNMGDAAFYIGACPNCTQVLENSHAQNSALGFSGTNAGGDFLIRNTEFDNNKTGLTSNSQNNDDQPSPQSGLCPPGESPPVLGAPGCTIFENNFIHDNNNPNVPGVGQGLSGGAPIGTGVVLGGTRFTTIYNNRVSGNGAWGVLVSDEPDFNESPPSYATYCQGGQLRIKKLGICWYQAWGNATLGNTFSNNGGFKNPSNGDVALIEPIIGPLPPPYKKLLPDDANKPGNCFNGNTDPAYGTDPSNGLPLLTSDPPPYNPVKGNAPTSYLQNPHNQYTPPNGNNYATCGRNHRNNGNNDPTLIGEAACNTQLLFPCPYNPVAAYPQQSKVQLMSLSQTAAQSPTMSNPCGPDSWGNVPPPNPWCVNGVYTGPSSKPGTGGVSASSSQQPGLPTTGHPAASGDSPLPLLPLLPVLIGAGAFTTRRNWARIRVARRRRAGPP